MISIGLRKYYSSCAWVEREIIFDRVSVEEIIEALREASEGLTDPVVTTGVKDMGYQLGYEGTLYVGGKTVQKEKENLT
jgi:hypothetical protein